jgi:Zinc finger, C3HC4 type (RING finger)
MPDISKLSRKHARSPTPQGSDSETSSSADSPPPDIQIRPADIPDACLACRKEKVTHLTVPCGHACLCRGCAMKMATGGKCKVFCPIKK